MQLTFSTIVANYDFNSDTLTATVSPIEENHSHERYAIDNCFSNRRVSITDITDEAGDVEPDYTAQILVAFLRAFKRAYYRLDASASPADVFDEAFEFTVELDE